MDSAGAQALAERFAVEHPEGSVREREEDAYAARCLEAHNGLLAIQERNRGDK